VPMSRGVMGSIAVCLRRRKMESVCVKLCLYRLYEICEAFSKYVRDI
jgi:hypothetical protein